MTLAIDVHGLNKTFGDKHVVNDVTIQVEQGRICGFLGPNGSGKTTTLRMLCGLLTPDSGSGEALGFDIIAQADEVKRRTGYMTQKFSLYEDLTIAENLQFTARVYGLDRRKDRVDKALERLGLATRRGQLAGTLSGGWKQRLALAAATLHEPKLLLLDEPTAGVDPKARRTFWDEIHALAAEGLTVLVSTHYMDEAERCHEIAYISYGRLIARGTAAEVIAGSGLITFHGEGPNADKLAHELATAPGVETAAAFGAAIHVSGTDRAALEAAVKPYRREPYRWTEVPPTLEDVFIQLMGQSQDNVQ
ncbi:MAG: ABC transporter ATP-binding protein [Alphaproteobacteria bacterium]|nr:ABC transporter ATP-binding protein [Alphaproteobacteria bacterium]MBU1516129.1 ABC transporter ATP-binding protein [Alphaproteobacteria bacterium]MBU2092656.1 ABC transporter ATP-binding protein [Alphaproteobacteria bacterium]MBU2151011.1 ABC transporter ATP-binding protein [Alphaproteobacteria bacterium]MBU2308447.1 ABC transporter ATP-binding protein [Alphaproteobacteria bacterium]